MSKEEDKMIYLINDILFVYSFSLKKKKKYDKVKKKLEKIKKELENGKSLGELEEEGIL